MKRVVDPCPALAGLRSGQYRGRGFLALLARTTLNILHRKNEDEQVRRDGCFIVAYDLAAWPRVPDVR